MITRDASKASCFVTDTGWVSCDGTSANGCETASTGTAPHEHVVDPTGDSYGGGCGGGGAGGEFVGRTGSCNVECDFGWSNCDGNALNGCETSSQDCYPSYNDDSSSDAKPIDASVDASSPVSIGVLASEPLGLVACAGHFFLLDGSELQSIDALTFVRVVVTTSPATPAGGLACDGTYVYWTTLADADASTPNGQLLRADVNGSTYEIVASGLDPGVGIDVRPAFAVYFFDRSSFGGPQIVAAHLPVGDGGAALERWMPSTPGPFFRRFALGAADDWSIAGATIRRRPLDADASFPWLPAPAARGLFADDAQAPYAILRMAPDDAGESDFFAQLDDEAGLALIDASPLRPIVTSTTSTPVVVASDDTVYAITLPSGAAIVLATTAEHVADVAADGTSAVWTTRGGSQARVWRAALP